MIFKSRDYLKYQNDQLYYKVKKSASEMLDYLRNAYDSMKEDKKSSDDTSVINQSGVSTPKNN